MKQYLKKGFKLLCYSTIFIIISSIYFNLFYEYDIAMSLGILLSLGFLYLWFYWGYNNKLGFKNGLFVGVIGASGGIMLAILSLLLLIDAPDASGLWAIYPWCLPFTSLFDIIPSLGKINTFFPHLSVIVVIIITAIGGYLGKRENKKIP